MGGKSGKQEQAAPAASGFQGQPYSATLPAGNPGQLEALAAQLQAGGYPVSLDDLQRMYSPTSVKSYQPIPGMSSSPAPAAAASAAVAPATGGGSMYDQPYSSISYLPNSNRR